MEVFTIRNLTFAYPEQEKHALSDLTLSVQPGEFLVLCGPSGCGKSTLLRQLKTVLAPHGRRSGEILFDGKNLDELPQREQAEKIGFVQQSPENQIVTDKVWHELAFGLESLGVDTPKWRTVRYTEADVDRLTSTTPAPCVVKPGDSGSSIGVSFAHDKKELHAALLEGLRFGGHCVLEQYVRGREVQVGVLEDRGLPSIEIIPKQGFYDYANKYQPGAAREITPAEIPAETEQRLADAALTVFHALNLSAYSRADFILDAEGELWFLEINTLPGMTPTSLVPQEAAAVGISYSELCEQIIAAALHK